MECVSFDLAKKLKEKGFGEKCYHYYLPSGELHPNKNQWRGGSAEDCLYSHNSLMKDVFILQTFLDAPTITQVVEWLESKYGLFIHVDCCWAETTTWDVEVKNTRGFGQWDVGNYYNSHKEALLAGIEFILTKLI